MEYVLYVLMRNDLDSLNNYPGKVAAQATHAANKMVYDVKNHSLPNEYGKTLSYYVNKWLESGGGFGTCIVLQVNYESLQLYINQAINEDLHAGIVLDPTYPLVDGNYTHLIPLETCGYIFGRKEDLPFLNHLSLY